MLRSLAASRQRSSRLTFLISALASTSGSNLPQRMSSVMNHRSWLWNGYEAKSRQYFMMCGLFSTILPGMP